MHLSERRYSECAIIPLSGRAVFTVPPIAELTLPTKPRRPFYLSRLLVVGLCAFGLWSFPTATHAAATSDQVFRATNIERSRANLGPLQRDARLDAAAQLKIDDMLSKNYFAHQSPTGQRGWNWMVAAGYEYTTAGENLAKDFADGGDVVTAWMTSATHRQNIISGTYTDIGIAVASGILQGKATTIIVAHFGRQTSTATAASVGSRAETPPSVTPVYPRSPRIEAPAEAPHPPIDPGQKHVPSLVDPLGVPVPTLLFTYPEPPASQPQVLGAFSSGNYVTAPNQISDEIAWMVLGALCISASIIGLASVVWPTIYPQPSLQAAIT